MWTKQASVDKDDLLFIRYIRVLHLLELSCSPTGLSNSSWVPRGWTGPSPKPQPCTWVFPSASRISATPQSPKQGLCLCLTQIKRRSPARISKEQMNTLIFLRCHLPAFLLSAFPWALGSRAVGFPTSTPPACSCAPPLPCFSIGHTLLLLLHWGKTATPLENHGLYVADKQSSLLAANPRGRRHILSRAVWDNEMGICKQLVLFVWGFFVPFVCFSPVSFFKA